MNEPSSTTRSGWIMLFSVLFVLAGGMTALQAQEESPNQGNISVSAGTNATTAYYFRGFLQEDDGFISQPWIELGSTLYEGENSSLSANAGLWWSLHSEKTGDAATAAGRSVVYEEDVYAGLSYNYSNVTFGLSYIFFTSPNDAFATIQEINYTVSYDDSDAFGNFTLSPSFTIAQETELHGGGDEAVYGELGLSPGTTLMEDKPHPVSVSLPTTFGFSLDDYYEDASGNDDAFGYLKTGPHASVPLASDTKWGSWTLSAGLDYYFLSADTLESSNGDDDSEIEGTISISMTY